MEATHYQETEARRRRLEELFQDEPFLSATMKASRLHEREMPTAAVQRVWEHPGPRDLISADAEMQPSDAKVTRLGFVVDIHQDPQGLRAEFVSEEVPDVMTTSEAARFLRVAEATIRRWVRERGLPCAHVGRARRFRKTALFRWLKTREQPL